MSGGTISVWVIESGVPYFAVHVIKIHYDNSGFILGVPSLCNARFGSGFVFGASAGHNTEELASASSVLS